MFLISFKIAFWLNFENLFKYTKCAFQYLSDNFDWFLCDGYSKSNPKLTLAIKYF